MPLGNGDSVLVSLYQGRGFHFFLDEKTKQKNQGLDDNMLKSFYTVLNISEPFRYATLLRSVIDGLSNDFLTRYRPRPKYKDNASSSFCTFTQMSPYKFFAYAGRLRPTAKNFQRHAFAYFWQDKSMSPCRGSSDKRNLIIKIALAELGVKEATNNNDGPRVEEYLRYTGLGKNHEWCAAFISWVYGQAGLAEPRNPWSPALFPKRRVIEKERSQHADLFAVYGARAKRINHVGLIRKKQGQYILTVEGNSNNSVESRRRHLRTVYAVANWVEGND